MRIGNNSGFDMMALMLKMQNNRNPRLNTIERNTNSQQAQPQPTNRMAEFSAYVASSGFTPPTSSAWERDFSSDGNLLTGLSQEHLEWRMNKQDPIFRANLFLHGAEGQGGQWIEAIGVQAMNQHLRESGIELPTNARFNIGVDRYGGITITGLDSEEMTRAIEDAMSYDSRIIISVLAIFVESARTLEGSPSNTNFILSNEQQRLIEIQSNLKNYGVGLNDLSFGANGRIQGLPQELYDRIYGDRGEWLSGMEPMEAKWENWSIDRIRDDIIHFLRNGTAHVPAPDILLTFDNGRMIVNSGSGFSTNNSGGFNVTV